MIKQFFRFGARIAAVVATVAFALTLGITTATAEFDVAPDSVEFERIGVQSEQTLIQSGFMDKTNYGWCSGWACYQQSHCGQGCFCKGGNEGSGGECIG